MILTRQTYGQRPNMSAESKRQALGNYFPERICDMFLMSTCRLDWDLCPCTTLVLVFGEPMRSGDFREKKGVSTQEKSDFCHCAAVLKRKSQSQAERRRRGACLQDPTPLPHHAVDSGPHFNTVSMNDTLHKDVKSNFTFFILLLLQTHTLATHCNTGPCKPTVMAFCNG